jgi:hypothetical protein
MLSAGAMKPFTAKSLQYPDGLIFGSYRPLQRRPLLSGML